MLIGFSKRPILLIDPRRSTATDWSIPDDFAASDTVRYYVNPAAVDDSANGLDPSTPKKTLAAGMALWCGAQVSNPGRPDQLLCIRDGVWTDQTIGPLTTTNATNGAAISGRSASQRLVIGAYGTGARPKIRTGALQHCLRTGSSAHMTSNIAILGLEFDSYLYPSGSGSDMGINWSGGGEHVLIEDCKFTEELQVPILFSLPATGVWQRDFVIRRNVFETILGSEGNWIKLGRTQGILIQENHFDGRRAISWTGFENSIGAGIEGDSTCWSEDVVVEGNTFSNYGTHAVYLNGGGVVRNNVIFLGGNGIQVGNWWQGSPPGFSPRPGGVVCEITGNYISDLMDVPSDFGGTNIYRGGRGIFIANTLPESVVADNILTRNTGTKPWCIEVYGSGNTASGQPCPVLDTVIRRNKSYRFWRPNNPYHYKGIFVSGSNVSGQPPDISGLEIKDNDFQEPAAFTSLLAQFDNTVVQTGGIISARNRFFRMGPPDDRYSPNGFGSTDIAGYRAALGDTTSVEIQVAYPDPDKTLGDYAGTIGLTATPAALVAAMRAQSRYTTGGASGWDDNLMAKNILAYMRPNFLG